MYANGENRPTGVLIVGMTSNIGGMETLIRGIVHACDSQTVHFDFLSNEPSIAFEQEFEAMGCHSYHVTARRQSRSRFHQELRVFFEVHAQDYDVVWENANSAANIDYLVYARRYGIPRRIMHCHNSKNGEGLVRGILHRMNRGKLRRVATDFWTVSDESSAWFFGRDYQQLPSYYVFSNAISLEPMRFDEDRRREVRRALGADEGCAVLLTTGRMVEQKNQKVILRAAARMVAAGEWVLVVIAGDGPLSGQLAQEARDLGIAERVRFLGMVQDTAPLYSAADVFFFPSLFEGLSISLLEAEANGLPVVTSSGIVKRALVNGNIVVVDVDDFNADHWVAAVHRAMALGRQDTRLPGSEFDLSGQARVIEGLLTCNSKE